jgi:hypothetical protein
MTLFKSLTVRSFALLRSGQQLANLSPVYYAEGVGQSEPHLFTPKALANLSPGFELARTLGLPK